jgi:hypothetical protein
MWPPYEITIYGLRLGTALILGMGAVLFLITALLALAVWGSWKLNGVASRAFAAGRQAVDDVARRWTRAR